MRFRNKTLIASWTLAAVLGIAGIALHLSPVTAQSNYLFKTLDARTGLTASQVNCILKDSRGFMWFGTPAGLYRFDGYSSSTSRAIRKTARRCPTAISSACRRPLTAACG